MKQYLCPVPGCGKVCAIEDNLRSGLVGFGTCNQHDVSIHFLLSAWPPHLIREIPEPWKPRGVRSLVDESNYMVMPASSAVHVALEHRKDIVRLLREEAVGLEGTTVSSTLIRLADTIASLP
jgi:hypothetical protein